MQDARASPCRCQSVHPDDWVLTIVGTCEHKFTESPTQEAEPPNLGVHRATQPVVEVL